MSDQVYVEIVHLATGDVVKRLGPMTTAKAMKVERGVLINLNHEEYFVRQVTK